MATKSRGATLTILAMLLALMVISNLHKPFAQHPGEGFVFFGTRLSGTSNKIVAPIFAAFLAVSAYGFLSMSRFGLPLGTFSAAFLISDALVAGKRFAFIGEPDHFIHEKYAYRLAMLKYLAGRGFTHLGEELGASDAMRINRFIATGDESQLERVTIYGYSGTSRTDRDDTPTGILSASFGDAYPTALSPAEPKRFAHGLR